MKPDISGGAFLRCAIYARVSKDDAGGDGRYQDPENQLVPLRKFADAMGWVVKEEFVDRVSGGNSNRPAFIRLRKEVRQRHYDVVLVWALDRFSRESLTNTLKYIEELKKYKTALKSYTESWLDTSDEGVGALLIAIFAWVAKQEREKISARTKAGLARAKKQGKKLGRPRKHV